MRSDRGILKSSGMEFYDDDFSALLKRKEVSFLYLANVWI